MFVCAHFFYLVAGVSLLLVMEMVGGRWYLWACTLLVTTLSARVAV